VEEVVQWNQELRRTKTFLTAVLILSGRRFESPNLELQKKVLHNFNDQTHSGLLPEQVSAGKAKIIVSCKLGWVLDGMCTLLQSI
jgi:hypothetical protein